MGDERCPDFLTDPLHEVAHPLWQTGLEQNFHQLLRH